MNDHYVEIMWIVFVYGYFMSPADSWNICTKNNEQLLCHNESWDIKVVCRRVLCHTMARFCEISYIQISIGYFPSNTCFLWILLLGILLLYYMTHYEIIIGYDFARDAHCDISMCNNVARYINCDNTMSNDVVMCTSQYVITMLWP